MKRRLDATVICVIAVVVAALGYVPASAQPLAESQRLPFEKLVVRTTLTWSVLAPSIDLVMGTDGRVHLAYEMLFTNTTGGAVSVDSVEVVDPDHNNEVVGINRVFTMLDQDITAEIRPFSLKSRSLEAPDYSHVLGPGESGVMYFDVTFNDFKSVPRKLAHQVSASAAVTDPDSAAPSTDEPAIVEEPMSPPVVAIGGTVKVNSNRAITVSPPLRGDGWIDANGCCARCNIRVR